MYGQLRMACNFIYIGGVCDRVYVFGGWGRVRTVITPLCYLSCYLLVFLHCSQLSLSASKLRNRDHLSKVYFLSLSWGFFFLS